MNPLAFFLVPLTCMVCFADALPAPSAAEMARAMGFFHRQQYSRALMEFEQLSHSCGGCSGPRFMAARCRLDLGLFAEAEVELEELVRQDPLNRSAWIHLGMAREALEDWIGAAEAFAACDQKGIPADSLTQALTRRSTLNRAREEIRERQPDLPPPSPLADVNSEADEYMPAVSVDGRRLFFTSNRSGGAQPREDEDFWVAELRNGKWQDPVNLGAPPNSALSEGSCSFTAEGSLVFFAACDRPEGLGDCDLYLSTRGSGGWSRPLNLGRPVNGPSWDSHPALSADGRRLIFSSNRPGGFGETDLWISERVEEGWSAPRNLGPVINTAGREETPFLHSDGHTLYYSSDGLPGFGGLDVFYSVSGEDGWSSPLNLGPPINSSGPDVGFVTPGLGRQGYYARFDSSKQHMDLYSCDVPACCRPDAAVLLQGLLVDADSGKGLGGRVRLDDRAGAGGTRQQWSDSSGVFHFLLPPGGQLVSASAPGYFFTSLYLDADSSEVHLRLPLQPIRIGESVVLEHLLFDYDRASLQELSLPILEAALNLLRENPGLVLELQGHTDSEGSPAYNLDLSQRRADSVRDWLLARGIAPERLVARGYGESAPRASNATPAGRAENRRSELLVLDFLPVEASP